MMRAYVTERFPPRLFVPLAAAIAVAASGGDYAAIPFAVDTVAAWLLVAELRLWDDLADRAADRVTHPERVLAASVSIRPFVVMCSALAVINAAWTASRTGVLPSLAILAGLHGALGLWYARRTMRTLAGDQLLLAKYPALVLVLAGERVTQAPLVIGLSAAAVYIAASAYEAWHDPVSPLGALLGGRS
jgi:hypothetical protein